VDPLAPWNIDPNVIEIRENSVPQNAVQGTSDFGAPSTVGHALLRVSTDIISKLTHSMPPFRCQLGEKSAVEKAMTGHVIAKGSLMGTYSRGALTRFHFSAKMPLAGRS